MSVQERICFELDHYDRHNLSQDQAVEADLYVWRANLLGGGRLVDMARRFSKMRTLANHLEEREGWVFGEGFIIGTGPTRPRAPFLEGRPFLPTEAFTSRSGIDKSRITKVEETPFESPRTEKHFSAPLVSDKGERISSHSFLGRRASCV